jgi:hypothetical protein
MAIKSRRVTVRVAKTIQEADFEPFGIVLEDSVEYDTSVPDAPKVRRQMYKKLEKELDKLIDKRWDKMEDDDD